MTDACSRVERLLSLHLDGELPPDLRREVEEHLDACAGCRATLDAWSRLSLAAVDILRQAVPADPLNVRPGRPARRLARAAAHPGAPQWIPLAAAGLLVMALGTFLAIRTGAPRQGAPRVNRLPAAEETRTAEAPPEALPDRATRTEPPRMTGASRPPRASVPPTVASQRPPDPPRPERTEAVPKPAPAIRPDDRPPLPPGDAEAVRPPPRAETVAIAARIDALQGDASVITGAGPLPARPGFGILPGQGIATQGPIGHAVLTCPDGTRLELGADTAVTRVDGPTEDGTGRQVVLARGTLDADVARQPAGRSLRFATPLAEVVVLGTRLRLTATPASTRVEVRQGRVRLTRLADRAEIEVRGGQVATALETGPLTVRPSPDVTLSFQDGLHPDPGYAGTRDTTLREDTPERGHGTLSTCYVDSDDPGGTGQNVCALVRWDLTRIPPGSIVTSARVSLEITSSVKRRPYPLFEVLKPWDEEGATWVAASTGTPWDRKGAQGAGDRGRLPLAKTPADVGKGPLVLRLNARGVAVVQAWVNRPDANWGILFDHDNNPDGMDFKSRETRAPSQRPWLTVTFIPAPGPERR